MAGRFDVAGRFYVVAGRFDMVAGRFDTQWWLEGLIHGDGLRYLFCVFLFCFGEVIICSFIKFRNCS